MLVDFILELCEKVIIVVGLAALAAAVIFCIYCLFFAWFAVAWWYLPLGLFLAAVIWAVIDFIEDKF